MRLRIILAAVAMLAVAAPGTPSAQAGRRGDVLDANTASEKQLRGAPGLTPELAKAVVERRPFLTATDLDSVLGTALSGEQRASVYRHLFVQIDLNTATDDELLLIPGFGPGLLGELKQHRPYRALGQFRRELSKHVDPVEMTRLEQYVFVPINLNTATDADILSIPGLGQRMLNEFKEYRPYRTIQQFRREMGKYVDAKEVARLERYVTVN